MRAGSLPPLELHREDAAHGPVDRAVAELPVIGNAERGLRRDVQVEARFRHRGIGCDRDAGDSEGIAVRKGHHRDRRDVAIAKWLCGNWVNRSPMRHGNSSRDKSAI